ncbi:uncharacterized protein METZ01_LOCUS467535 [marine metagenome]|uniref:Uncharacterized protein n=1 Tax=marine metagenome TaxID=408172 RepID=A0A383B451_9ZZZZ
MKAGKTLRISLFNKPFFPENIVLTCDYFFAA